MAIYSGKDALLKIEYPAGSGVYVNAAYLTQTSISESTSPIVAGDLLQHTVAQFVTGDNAPINATADASGYIASDTSHYFLQRLYESRTAFSARIYISSVDYFQGTAKLSSLSISGGYNDAAAVSMSVQLTGVEQSKAYAAYIESLDAVHHWPINETSGSTIADLIGGANGTIQGTPVLGLSGFVESDTAIDASGSAEYISLPDAQIQKDTFDSSGAVVAWLDPDLSGSSQRAVLMLGTNTAIKPFFLRVDEAGLYVGAKNSYSGITVTGVSLPASAKGCIVLNFGTSYSSGAGNYSLWVNGEAATLATGSVSSQTVSSLSNLLNFYTLSGGNQYWNGRAGHISLHSRNLTAAEVAQIWAYRSF